MIDRRARFATVLLAALLVVLPACSSGDGDSDGGGDPPTTVTGATGPVEFSTSPSDDWGDLADCPIPPQSADPEGTPATEGVDGVLAFGEQTPAHVTTCVDYPVNPAVGGDHFPQWANCGFYTAPVPEEVAVHVLEHGGVWIAFDPSIGDDDVATIRAATEATTHILANPYPGLTSEVVLSAWSRQLRLDSASDPRFDEFIDTYLQGPGTPELGAPCRGGLGSPAR